MRKRRITKDILLLLCSLVMILFVAAVFAFAWRFFYIVNLCATILFVTSFQSLSLCFLPPSYFGDVAPGCDYPNRSLLYIYFLIIPHRRYFSNIYKYKVTSILFRNQTVTSISATKLLIKLARLEIL